MPAASRSTRLGVIRRGADVRGHAADPRRSRGRHRPAHAGRAAVAGPAADGRDRQGPVARAQAADPRRAHLVADDQRGPPPLPRHPAPRRAGRRDHLCLAPHGRDLRDLRPRDGHEGRPRHRRARDRVGDARRADLADGRARAFLRARSAPRAAGRGGRARGPRPRRPTPVVSASFSLRYGEIVCLAGLLGAGRTEVCEAIFGARPIQSGSVLVDGQRAARRTARRIRWRRASRCCRRTARRAASSWTSRSPPTSSPPTSPPTRTPACSSKAEMRAGQPEIRRRPAHRHAEHRSRGAQPLGRQPAEGAARQMAGAPAAHPDRRRADARRRCRLQGRHLPHPARPRGERHGAARRLLRPAGGARAGAPHRRHVGGPGRRRARRRDARPRSPSSSSPRPKARQERAA